jgi:hypothetical protein
MENSSAVLGVDMVREVVARRERGLAAKRIARELGVDRKTVKRWLKLGVWQPRQTQRRVRELDRRAAIAAWASIALVRRWARSATPYSCAVPTWIRQARRP